VQGSRETATTGRNAARRETHNDNSDGAKAKQLPTGRESIIDNKISGGTNKN